MFPWFRPIWALLPLGMLASPALAQQGDIAVSNDKPEVAPVETLEQRAARLEAAKVHFAKAIALRDQKNLAAAAAEYLEARRIFPTWSATAGAARCYQLLFRYDEALDLYDVLLRDFSDILPKAAKTEAQKALIEMRGLVGTVEIVEAEVDAAIMIDGRSRGTFPSPNPIRVPAGAHVVRVYMEGFEPFESSLDIVGNRVHTVEARLRKLDLRETGRLRVSEAKNRPVQVVIDGNIVGTAPWEGTLLASEHTVTLVGDDSWGTQPVRVRVPKQQTETLAMIAEKLDADLRITPTPVGATVAIDSVNVGLGVWQGKLRHGKHRLEVASEGFVLDVREVNLRPGEHESLKINLDRDPLSPLWKDNRGRVFVEAAIGPNLIPTLGGALVDECVDVCSHGIGVGVSAMGRGGYRFPSGFFVGIEAGYFYARQALSGRETTIHPAGLSDEYGTVDDTLSLRGVRLGATAGIRLGTKPAMSLRLGVGGVVGGLFRDHRVGTMQTNVRTVGAQSVPSQPYSFDVVQASHVNSLLVTPGFDIAFPLAERLHLLTSLEVGVLVTPNKSIPTWSPEAVKIDAGTSGQAVFSAQQLMSSVVVFITPAAVLRYEF